MFDAIVLAGGDARRLDGADKIGIEVGGIALLDRVVAAANGAERVIAVGPERPAAAPLKWVREDPPGGGPVAALAAAMSHVEQRWTLVLAADLPWIAPAVPLLLTAAAKADVAVLAVGGRRNHLAAVWRSDRLRAAIERLDSVAGAAARELFVGIDVAEVVDEDEWGVDCDTWDDVEHARAKGTK
jgi:molybdopterin-guanine dinucleotide biosynthesis protein A